VAKDKKISTSVPARKPVAKSALRKTQPIHDKDGHLKGSKPQNLGKTSVPEPQGNPYFTPVEQEWLKASVQQARPDINALYQGILPLMTPQNTILPYTTTHKIKTLNNMLEEDASNIIDNNVIELSQNTSISSKYEEAYKSFQKAKEDGIPLPISMFIYNLNKEMGDLWFSFKDIDGSKNYSTLQDYKDRLIPDDIDNMDLCSEVALQWKNWIMANAKGWDLKILEIAYQTYNSKIKSKSVNCFVNESGEQWIVDYSARQYDRRAPFPLVQPFPLWRTWVDKHMDERCDEQLGPDLYKN